MRIRPFVDSRLWLIGAAVLLLAMPAWGVGNINGHGRFEKVKGQPAAGYVELYETNLFLSPPASPPTGPSRRLGTTCESGGACSTAIITYDGCYCASGLPAGSYSVLMNQPIFFIAPKVVPNVEIKDGQTVTLNPELPIDYSTYIKTDWTGPASAWYQTFVATGTAVRGIAFMTPADVSGSVQVSLLRNNGNADVRNWQVVVSRSTANVHALADSWVRFRSADAPMDPGTRYAVRLSASSLQVNKRNKGLNSYVGGQAFDAQGQPQNFDLNITVFTDNDNTRVTMNKRTPDHGVLRDNNFAGQWTQTFTAGGVGVAAVDLWAAGDVMNGQCSDAWNFDVTWRIRQGGPGGPQVGPTKTTKAAYQAFGVGLHGVSYNPGEVNLTAGQVYAIEMSYAAGPACHPNGYNPFVMNDDSYAGGTAYIGSGGNWIARTEDLSMTVVEYTVIPPIIAVEPVSFSRSSYMGDPMTKDVFTVRNAGGGTLSYTIRTNVPWLTIRPEEGDSTGEEDAIDIEYHLESMPVSVYEADVTVETDAPGVAARTVHVTVNVHSVGPDFDGDGDVDQEDFGFLQKCFNGLRPITDPACERADVTRDGYVNQVDYQRLRDCMSGANHPADRECE